MSIWLVYEEEKKKIKHLPRKQYEKELQKIIERLKL